VEMGGIEPPSRTFSRRSPTGLVDDLCRLTNRHRHRFSQASSRLSLVTSRERSGHRIPDLRRSAPILPGAGSGERLRGYATQRGRVLRRLWFCPFLRVPGRPRPAIYVPTALSNPARFAGPRRAGPDLHHHLAGQSQRVGPQEGIPSR
jgi:hypothetical protein